MALLSWVLFCFLAFFPVSFVQMTEYCKGLSITCDYYCCGTFDNMRCCKSCVQSLNFHPECYTTSITVGPIIGGIASFIIFVIIVSLIIALCCGYICSSRTGIQRRGQIIQTGEATVTVTNPNGTSFVQNPSAYPPGQMPFPNLESGVVNYHKAAVPPYSVGQTYGNPPPYNPEYYPNHK